MNLSIYRFIKINKERLMENSFGEFLRKKRIEKDLTQKELAGLLIISESAISKWEKGEEDNYIYYWKDYEGRCFCVDSTVDIILNP